MGNDMGGGLVQFVADAHPERIGRLVLTNCDALDEFPPFPYNAALALMRGPALIGALMWPTKFRPLRQTALALTMNHPDPEQTAAWLTPCRTDPRIRRDLATLVGHLRRTDGSAVAARLARFAKPVTVVWGQADRSFTPELGRRVAAIFSHATLVEVSGAKTFVALDNPDVEATAISEITGIDIHKPGNGNL
ncbi:alpha/beta fold hydrolase [Mycobacterium sp. BMJ-28]